MFYARTKSIARQNKTIEMGIPIAAISFVFFMLFHIVVGRDDWIRTSDLGFRRPLLYPTELRPVPTHIILCLHLIFDI